MQSKINLFSSKVKKSAQCSICRFNLQEATHRINLCANCLEKQHGYLFESYKVIQEISRDSAGLEDLVGHCIYSYISEIAGPSKAPIITGMLLD